jgi:predicted dehydrogenase
MQRRSFIKKSLIGAATVGSTVFIPGGLSAIVGEKAASNRVRVALIGCRNQGWSDMKTFLQYPEVECVSLCDVDDEWLNSRAAEYEKIKGQKPKQLVKDWRRVIDNKDVDVVIVGTPDHWHCLIMIAACEAGKDVYVEKPLANSIEECNLMVKAARRYNRVVQVNQWQRSDTHWDEAAQFVLDGKIGKVRTAKAWAYQTAKWKLPIMPDSTPPNGVDYDMWLGPAPKRPFNQNRFHYNFRFFWDYAGGLMADWGVHLLDYALKGMNAGLPSYIFAGGGNFGYTDNAMETPDTMMVTYRYPDFNIIWDHACGIGNGLFDKPEGVVFYGEDGTLVLTRAGWEALPEMTTGSRMFPYCYPCDTEKKAREPRMEALAWKKGDGKGMYNHVGNMLDCIKSRQLPNCDIQIGATVANLSHLGNISSRVGRGIEWDDAMQSIKNDDEAQLLTKAKYYNNWKLPVV